MRYVSLVWAGLWRSRTRTMLTLLSAIVAFLLFGVLNGVDAFLKQTVGQAHLDVLITGNPGGLPLPMAYFSRLQGVPGVKSVTYVGQLGGYYRAPGNNVSVFMTDAETFFRTYSDMQTSSADQLALAQTKTGALVTTAMSLKFGWKRGDTISIHSIGTPQKNGSKDWQFKVVGFFNYTASSEPPPVLIANYSYYDLTRATNAGTVQQYWTLIKNPNGAGTISEVIDNIFVNSSAQTRTMSQKDVAQSALARIGNVEFFLDAIISAVFFTLLLLVGNALMQSFRERIREFAVLKTLGFSDTKVAALVAAESLMLCMGAAVMGLMAAWFVLPIFAKISGGSGLPHPPLTVVLFGMGGAILVGLICGAVPAWKARRLTIVGALAAH